MKTRVRFLLLLVVFCVYGCGNESLQNTLLTLTDPSEVNDLPPELQAQLWDDPAVLQARLLEIEQDDTQPVWVAEAFRIRICKAEQQRRYYTRYIDAEGIAIIGNADVTDAEFLIARNIVLKMTAKRPELRQWLTPEWRYRVILIAGEDSIGARPEVAVCEGVEGLSKCGFAGLYESIADLACQWRTLVHEFAHAMERAISCYDQKIRVSNIGNCYYDAPVPLATLDFHNRLETAYEQAIGEGTWKGLYAETNVREYWAEGVVVWYYGIGAGKDFPTYEAFAAHDPLLAELLSEWFHEEVFTWPYTIGGLY